MAAGRKKGEGLLLAFRIVFTLCLGGTLLFIFYNSSQIGLVSGGRSEEITQLLNRLLSRMGFSRQFTHYQVRKLAHFGEYMLLGFWMLLTLRVYTRRLLAFLGWPLFFSLAIPVADECYQLLVPGRSGQLTDVIIDFGGAMVGLCVASVVLLVLRAFWEGLTGGQD